MSKIKVYDVKMKKIDVLKEYIKEKKFYLIAMFILAITLKATGIYNWIGFMVFILCSLLFRITDFFVEPKWKVMLK